MNQAPTLPRSSTSSLLAGQKTILDMVNRDAPIAETLEAICRLIESELPGALCSVLLVDDVGEHLLHGAAPSLPEDYCKAIHGITIGPSVGSCGTAAHTGQPVIVEEIATHPYWKAFKGLAHDTHGLSSCWSTPIRSYDGAVVATFAIYHRTPLLPSAHARKLIDFTSHLVCIAVNRERDLAAERAAA